MSTLNNFCVEVITNKGMVQSIMRESSEYYPLPHNTEYKLRLRNNKNTRCDAKVSIDGENVGTWRIDPSHTITIERPSGVARKFTFLKKETSEAMQAGVTNDENNMGLITVIFTPENKRLLELCSYGVDIQDSIDDEEDLSFGDGFSFNILNFQPKKKTRIGLQNYSAGGTGLGKDSSQTFDTVDPITDIDYENVTTINLRLICEEQNRPDFISLQNVNRSNTVPPPLRV